MASTFPNYVSPSRNHLNRAYALLKRADLQRKAPSPEVAPTSIVHQVHDQEVAAMGGHFPRVAATEQPVRILGQNAADHSPTNARPLDFAPQVVTASHGIQTSAPTSPLAVGSQTLKAQETVLENSIPAQEHNIPTSLSSTVVPKARFSQGITQPQPGTVLFVEDEKVDTPSGSHYKKYTQHIDEELTALKQQHGQALQEIGRLREVTEGLRRDSQSSSLHQPRERIISPAMTPVARTAAPVPTYPPRTTLPKSPATMTPRRTTTENKNSSDPRPRPTGPSPTKLIGRSAIHEPKAPLPQSARGKPKSASEVKKLLEEAKAKKEAESATRKAARRKSSADARRVQGGKSRTTPTEFDYTRRLLNEHKNKIEDHKRRSGSGQPVSTHNIRVSSPKQGDIKTRSPTGRKSSGSGSTPNTPLSPQALALHREILQAEVNHDLSPISDDDRTSPIGPKKTQPRTTSPNCATPAVPLTDDLLQVLVELPLAPTWQLESVIERFSHDRPRDWIVMTSLLNHPSVIQCVVCPLLVEDLMDPQTNKTRGEMIIKAIVGLGHTASAALEPLLDLLYTNRLDRKLVSLAIRAVGGERALERLSEIILTNPSATIRSAAVYALCLMPEPIQGRTTICVSPTNSEINSPAASFFEASNVIDELSDDLDSQISSDLECHAVVKLPKPKYTPTHVVLELENAKNILRPFIHSPQYRPRAKYSNSTNVLIDFFYSVPMLLRGMSPLAEDVSEAYLSALASSRADLQRVLDATVTSRIPFDYASFVAPHAKLRSITMTTLMQRLVDETEIEIQKEIVAGLILLPAVVTVTVFEPLVHFAETLSRSVSVELHCGMLVLLGKLASGAHKEHHDILRRVLKNLGKCLDSENHKVREAAAVALGLAGEEASTSVDLVVIQHNQRRLSDEVTCSTLANIGRTGIAVLLDLVENKERKTSTRVWAAKSVGRAPISPTNMRSVDLLETIATTLCDVINEGKEDPALEELCVCCVEALGQILRPFAPSVGDSLTEEAIQIYQDEKQSPLVEQLLPVIAQCSNARLREVSSDTLSRFGGSHAEVALIQLSMKNDSPLVRATAVKSLAFRGASALRPVALATADADEDVRLAALTVLGCFGLELILSAVRARPEDQKIVLLKCCQEYLRFRGSQPLMQKLHELLMDEVQ